MDNSNRRHFIKTLSAATVVGSGLLSGCFSPSDDSTGTETTAPGAAQTAAESPENSIGVGVYLGDDSALAPWEEWLGRTVDYYSLVLPRDSWDDYRIESVPFEAPIDPIIANRNIVVTVRMFPPSVSTLSAVAAGGHTEQHRNFGRNLVDNGLADATLRIAHEFNGRWSSDTAVGRPNTFVEAWKRVVGALDSVEGSNFNYIWAPSNGREQMDDPTDAYPGDEWVDMIGPTVYDTGRTYYSQCDERPIEACREEHWEKILNEEFGLDWWAEFARDHDKTFTLPEYGITARSYNDAGGGDNPNFFANIAEWMSANSDVVGWHNVWSFVAGPHYIGPEQLSATTQYPPNPDASEEFKAQFG